MLAEGKVIWDVAVWIRLWGVLDIPLKQESPKLNFGECKC